jgi:hypothetical protein
MPPENLKKKARTRIIIGDASTTGSFVKEQTIKLKKMKRGGKGYEFGTGRKKGSSTTGSITSSMGGRSR